MSAECDADGYDADDCDDNTNDRDHSYLSPLSMSSTTTIISIRGHQHQIALCGTTHIDSLMTYLVIMIVMMMMMIDDDDAGDNG